MMCGLSHAAAQLWSACISSGRLLLHLFELIMGLLLAGAHLRALISAVRVCADSVSFCMCMLLERHMLEGTVV